MSSKSTASLVLQVASLRSQILTQDQLLERAQKSREAQNEELTVSLRRQLEELRAESADLRNKISGSRLISPARLRRPAYELREGVVTKSNGLELMRAIGLRV